MRIVRQMPLTPELVARVHREAEDTGQEEGVRTTRMRARLRRFSAVAG